MYPVSDRFLEALKSSHDIVTRVEVYDKGQKVRTLQVQDGSVEVDGRADFRRRMSCTVVDDGTDLNPGEAESLLAPYGNEVKLYRGLQYPADRFLDSDDDNVSWGEGSHAGTVATGGDLALALGT